MQVSSISYKLNYLPSLFYIATETILSDTHHIKLEEMNVSKATLKRSKSDL